jgi:hypothetical protein
MVLLMGIVYMSQNGRFIVSFLKSHNVAYFLSSAYMIHVNNTHVSKCKFQTKV